MNNKKTTAGHALSYLALGDSYTIGEAVPCRSVLSLSIGNCFEKAKAPG